MEKIAHDTELTPQALQKVAAFGFAAALATPLYGFTKAQTKKATALFNGQLKRALDRKEKIAKMLREHVAA